MASPTEAHAQYLITQSFPTGKFRDTAPNKPPFRWSFAPMVYRFAGADTLDVALVVRAAQVNGQGSPGTLVGLADVALTLGRVTSDRDFTAIRS